MPIIEPTERLRRAEEAIGAAKKELDAIPPDGRERTYAILRARKHLREARKMCGAIVRPWGQVAEMATNEQKQAAREMIDKVNEMWPAADYGKEGT